MAGTSRGEEAGQSTDADAYDLILKDKERLLSFAEPVRFIFSHSALREGWDNPNVFVMGMLKKSDNTVSRRQEIGRGLRLAVDQHGERMDNPITVHDINELTVVTDESYTDFVDGLQKEIAASLAARPRKASVKFFTGKTIRTESGESVVEEVLAQALYKYLIKNDYLNDDDTVSDAYKEAKESGTLAVPTSEALKPVIDFVWPLVDALYIDVPLPTDDRKPKKIPLNDANFAKKEFQALWGRDAPAFGEVADWLAERLAGRVVVAHNAPYDLAFLVSEFERADIEPPDWPVLCTMELACRLGRTGSLTLSACCADADVALSGAHTALGDALGTAGLLRRYLPEAAESGLADLVAMGCVGRLVGAEPTADASTRLRPRRV